MVDAWPNDVNLFAKRESYGEQTEPNVVRSQPDVGPPQERRRSSLVCDLITFEGRYTAAEYASLKAFHKTTLLSGTLPFTRAHPLTEVAGVLFKFVEPPALVRVGTRFRHVSIKLRLLP